MRKLSLSILSLAFFLAQPCEAGIVINELLPNPSGDDVGTERLEIYNNGPTTIDVTGWAIDDAATIDETAVRARIPEDFDTSVCPASALIGPGEFRVVKGQSTNPFLNNSGDDVYLITDRTLNPHVEDVVTYGSASSQSGRVWACVPDGSENFDWDSQSLCGTNGGGGDVTAPADITDLSAAQGQFPGEVWLTWTATGDDGSVGTASAYSIKVSSAPITSANFDAATDLTFWINEPVPVLSGTPESLLVSGMEIGTTFFFAIKAIDDASNASGVSNSPSVEPAPGVPLDTDFGLTAYFGNLHSHTGYSDGEQTPTDAYNYARFTAPTPLDFLAVTDHNHAGAGMSLPNYHLGLGQAAAANVDGSFVAIYGQEFGLSAGGHVIIFEAPTLFGWDGGNFDVFVAEGDYAGLYAAVVANPPVAGPPLALWAHPASSHYDGLAVTPDSPDVVKLICLVNGPANSSATDESDIGNTGFDDTFQDALRIGHRVSPTADQDNHNANWGATTQSRTGVLAPSLTKTNILTALSNGQNYATQDHNAVVGFSAEGRMMGEAFTAGSGIRIAIEVSDPDPGDVVNQIELYRGVTGLTNATRVAFSVGNSRLEWRETDEFANGTEAHYYVRIRQADNALIWTAPAYVTYDDVTSIAQDDSALPRLVLQPLRPNPVTDAARVRFELPGAGGVVSLDVVDVTGRRVQQLVQGSFSGGSHVVEWDGIRENASVAPGVYFVRLTSADFGATTQKLVVVR